MKVLLSRADTPSVFFNYNSITQCWRDDEGDYACDYECEDDEMEPVNECYHHHRLNNKGNERSLCTIATATTADSEDTDNESTLFYEAQQDDDNDDESRCSVYHDSNASLRNRSDSTTSILCCLNSSLWSLSSDHLPSLQEDDEEQSQSTDDISSYHPAAPTLPPLPILSSLDMPGMRKDNHNGYWVIRVLLQSHDVHPMQVHFNIVHTATPSAASMTLKNDEVLFVVETLHHYGDCHIMVQTLIDHKVVACATFHDGLYRVCTLLHNIVRHPMQHRTRCLRKYAWRRLRQHAKGMRRSKSQRPTSSKPQRHNSLLCLLGRSKRSVMVTAK
jgi:hypothetical protein